MASRFDDEIWELVPEDDAAQPPRHLVDFVRALPRVASALDLGCGDGRLSAELRAGALTLADVSPLALERARRRQPQAVIAELEPDAPLPLPDGSFDLVLCAETIEHVRDVQLLLSEARRVLRPDGALAITTPAHGRLTGLDLMARGFERRFDPLSPHLRFLTRRSLTAVMEGAGLEIRTLRRQAGTLMAVAER